LKTKEKIILKSLELFNASGSKSVTTNHIAQALQISPGNLYYHFRSKEAIIQALFDQHVMAFEEVIQQPQHRPFTLATKAALLDAAIQNIWNYRFIYQDKDHLLAEDNELFVRNREFFKENIHNTLQLHYAMREDGLLQGSDEALQSLTLNTWVTATGWISFANAYLKATDQDTVASALARHCIYQIFAMEKPFMTEKAQQELDQIEDQYRCDEIAALFC